MSEIKFWDKICKDWENIPLESYKFLFNQAKDRYDEIISESISITEKSINLTKLAVTILSGFVAYNFKVKPGPEWIVILSFFFLIDLLCLIVLMFPKGVIFKGSPPKELFKDHLDNTTYSDDEKVIVIYYHELVRYQERIEKMNERNNQRQRFYGFALILTIALTCLTAGIIINTIL